MDHASWETVRADLRRAVGTANFKHWIEPLDFAGHDGETATFHLPSRFQSEWVANNYGGRILSALNAGGMPTARVAVEVAPRLAAMAGGPAPTRGPGTARAPAAAHDGARHLEATGAAGLPGAPLDRRFTFDRFVTGRPNELAVAAARRVAETDEVSFNPLFLYGGSGLGKTHLMHAVAWETKRRQPEARVLYLTAERFMYHFVQALRGRGMMDFKQTFRAVDLLMVDDVQFIAGKDSTQEEFFHTFNALVDQGKQIVLSADKSPGEIERLESRIVSRLQSGLAVDVHPTDYELRLGILETKAEAKLADAPEVEIAPGVLDYLARQIAQNVRVLEGAINRLFAHQSLMGGPIDLAMVHHSLADLLRASQRKLSLALIQRTVAEHYNIRLADLIGPRRTRAVARPRQVAMYLAKTMTQRSLPEIGRDFGGRDHTTILHGVRQIERLKGIDETIAGDLELLRRQLEA